MQLILRIILYVKISNYLRANINGLPSIIRHSMTWLSKANEFDNKQMAH